MGLRDEIHRRIHAGEDITLHVASEGHHDDPIPNDPPPVDGGAVIRHLLQQIADLSLENAKLKAMTE